MSPTVLLLLADRLTEPEEANSARKNKRSSGGKEEEEEDWSRGGGVDAGERKAPSLYRWNLQALNSESIQDGCHLFGRLVALLN